MQNDTGLRNHDKLNKVDFQWFIVRTLPHQEEKLAEMLKQHQAEAKNILEVYCPTHTTVEVMHKGKEVQKPLFAGYVFVLSTQQVLMDFLDRNYPEGIVLYERRSEDGKKANVWTIPEKQMRAFRDFNENYAEHVVVLERPYSDYAFNPKTNEPNEIVKVLDGPLKGRVGFLTRFRRDKRLVFNMKSLDGNGHFAVSIPHIWNFHVVRLHNAEADRQTVGTMKERAVDLLIGMLQGCGYGDWTLPMLYEIIGTLVIKPSFADLCNTLRRNEHTNLSRKIAQMGTDDAELVLNLVRYELENPGYVKEHWNRLVIRPFLTPTSGMEPDADSDEMQLQYTSFNEIIRKVNVTEQAYYTSREQEETIATTYYAHVGVISGKRGGTFTLFANWDEFLSQYFLTAGKANERLVGSTIVNVSSFRNYAPTLYKVLTDHTSKVKAVPDFKVGDDSLNVFAISATEAELETAKEELIETCLSICLEINATTHLAVWRRYLRTVWLHR